MSHFMPAFIMLDQKIAKKLRLVYGLRAEYYNLNRINAAMASVIPEIDVPMDFSDLYSREPNWNYFPSLNITYSLNTSMNLRLAYSKSIIRPDLRELTWFKEYDFELGGAYESYGQLVSTKIDHYDFKFEWYPTAGELISVSLFYKKLKYPMEIYAKSGNRQFELRNDKDATNKGIELELRKSLGFTGIPALKGLTVFGNFTRLFADVRPMQNGYHIRWPESNSL